MPIESTRMLLCSAALGLAFTAACVVGDLDLEGRPCPCATGYECDDATNRCVKPGASTAGGGGEGASTMTGGGSTSEGPGGASGNGGGGAGGSGPAAPPLVVAGSIGSGFVTAKVDGAFQLDFTSAQHWAPERWFDLALPSPSNLAAEASSHCLHNTWLEYNAGWTDVPGAPLTSVTMKDESPVRMILENVLQFPNGGPFEVRGTYTVWASGHMAVNVEMKNLGVGTESYSVIEFNHASVLESRTWQNFTFASGRAFAYQGGNSTLLVASRQASEIGGSDFETNRYWNYPGQAIPSGSSVTVTGDFFLGLGNPGETELAVMVGDTLSPAIAVEGAAKIGGTFYDAGAGAYRMAATDTLVRFAPTSAEQRRKPAFVIEDWTHANFKVSFGDKVIATSASPSSEHAHAYYDAAASRLLVVSLGTIPMTATTDERTFVLEAE